MLKEKYVKEISVALKEKLKIDNVMDIPKVDKVVLNMGIGNHIKSGNKDFSSLQEHLKLISGQAPTVRHARKAISNFKLRVGMPVGLTVTLRGDNMYSFLEKLVSVVLPRVRDFRGVNKNGFDKAGNYNLGLKDHSLFLEVPQDDVIQAHGIQITVNTTAKNQEDGRELLQLLGFPFSK